MKKRTVYSIKEENGVSSEWWIFPEIAVEAFVLLEFEKEEKSPLFKKWRNDYMDYVENAVFTDEDYTYSPSSFYDYIMDYHYEDIEDDYVVERQIPC